MKRAIFWILFHNCIAHPLHGIAQASALVASRLHDWSAGHMV